MTKTPPIPREQRSFDKGKHDRRDDVTELQSGQPGDADANLEQQGRYGNIKQNLKPQHKVQDR